MTPEQQEILTRIGPGTPMGELFRRYWIPIKVGSEISNGSIHKIRVLCENLVLFRDTEGNPGVIEEQCPHRGTSFAYGQVDDEGIRCPYHGWKFNAAGKCLEMPAEENPEKLCARVKARAYPVKELGGLIFVYMGPVPAPLLPNYDLYIEDNVIRDVGYALIPCNWLQIMENSVDPFHVEWLHGHHLAHIRSKKGLTTPTYYRRHQIKVGFDRFEHGIIKRRIVEGGTEQDDDWAIGHPLIFPNMLRVGAHHQHRFQIRVPVDDENTLHFWYSCYFPANRERRVKQQKIPGYEVPWQDENGDFIVDFVDGGDIMSWVTQGRIADRTTEILGSSDKGIALYRKLLFEQIDEIRKGNDPLGIIRDPAKNRKIDLPQEREKFGQGASFLAESMEMGHARYSPIKAEILNLIAQDE